MSASDAAAFAADPFIGPLEERYRESAAFRAASDATRVTPTHVHIAVANGLGWMFDGMDGVIFALASPLIIKDFGVTIPQYRSGLQIALLLGISGMFVWPWLADRYGRRTLLALNIAMFSAMMPLVAAAQTWAWFVAARVGINFALNGEWALGSMLVAETWPARLRGRVIGINRGTWCFGASLAGVVATLVIAPYGWRIACAVPAAVALLAVYVRAKCPESPYWVRTQDRKRRIAEAEARGAPVNADDRAWIEKARKVPLGQIFLPDMRRNTTVATFVACCSTIIYGTVGGWMPLYLAQERHWSTATYGSFYIAWGLAGFLGLLCAGWISDRFGRRPAFYVMLAEGAVFITSVSVGLAVAESQLSDWKGGTGGSRVCVATESSNLYYSEALIFARERDHHIVRRCRHCPARPVGADVPGTTGRVRPADRAHGPAAPALWSHCRGVSLGSARLDVGRRWDDSGRDDLRPRRHICAFGRHAVRRHRRRLSAVKSLNFVADRHRRTDAGGRWGVSAQAR